MNSVGVVLSAGLCRPTPRRRQHRAFVRHRHYIRGRMTFGWCKIRRILGDDHVYHEQLFSAQRGKAYVEEFPLSDSNGYMIGQLWSEYEGHEARLLAVAKTIKLFATKALKREARSTADDQEGPRVGVCQRRLKANDDWSALDAYNGTWRMKRGHTWLFAARREMERACTSLLAVQRRGMERAGYGPVAR